MIFPSIPHHLCKLDELTATVSQASQLDNDVHSRGNLFSHAPISCKERGNMNLSFITLFTFLASTSFMIIIVRIVMASQTSPDARIRRRLIAIGSNPNATQSQIQDLFKVPTYSQVHWFNLLLSRLNFVRGIDNLLERANMDMSVGTFYLFSLLLGGFTLLTLNLFNLPIILALLLGIIALSVPYVYVGFLARKRLKLFLQQMADGLAGISQGLEAGMGLLQSLTTVTKDMPDPFGTEFTIFYGRDESRSLPDRCAKKASGTGSSP